LLTATKRTAPCARFAFAAALATRATTSLS